MRDCDTLLIVGSNFPYSQFLPEFDQARAVQIDIDGRFIGMRYPTEVNLVGDAATTLRALVPLLHRQEDRSWRETVEGNVAAWWQTMHAQALVEGNVAAWWQTMHAQALVEADPVNPMRLFAELSPQLPPDAIVTADPARRRTGAPGSCVSPGTSADLCRERWPRWGARSRTRSARSSPTRTDR